jgi:peptidoglycan hydrolase-like protein with peptidoglycan-binding domain
MSVLREGSTGDQVIQLQSKLKELGFDPGNVDGDFGPQTTRAVFAFQRAKGLQLDGTVGPETFAALQFEPLPADSAHSQSGITRVTPEIVSRMFPSTPMGNIRANFPFVLAALDEDGLGDKSMILMALGTIRAETASFMPINEGISRFNTSHGGHPFDLYDNRRDLGNQGRPDGANFRGRGFVQLTGRANYTKFSAELGLGSQLVTHPETANDQHIAAKLLSRFLKDKEGGIRRALANDDLKTARRLVNGGSHGLSGFTIAFRTGEHLIA